METGAMLKKGYLALFVACLLFALSAAPAAGWTVFVEQTFDDTADVDEWYPDRKEPGVFEQADFDGDYRLLHGIRGADEDDASFYNYQGMKLDTPLPDWGMQRHSIDLYVGSDWLDEDRNAGIWGVGYDAEGDISAYPILAYRNMEDLDAGFYSFDYYAGGWDLFYGLSEAEAWYNLSFVLTRGVGVEYFVDGNSLGVFEDPWTRQLETVILNAYNFGEDYDVYWDNFQAAAVPEPATMSLLGLGVVGVALAKWRRRKA